MNETHVQDVVVAITSSQFEHAMSLCDSWQQSIVDSIFSKATAEDVAYLTQVASNPKATCPDSVANHISSLYEEAHQAFSAYALPIYNSLASGMVAGGWSTSSSYVVNTSGTSLTGSGSNDHITAPTNGGVIDGLNGIDTVTFSGSASNYVIAKNTTGYSVTKSGGGAVTNIQNVERLQFSDKKVALDVSKDGNTGKALEFIGTIAFNLISDKGAVGCIQGLFDAGYSMSQVCQTAINVGLINKLAGSSSDTT